MSSYLSTKEILSLGFSSAGKNVLISKHTTFYKRHLISIGNNVRIDDFCVLSGSLTIGDYCHLAPHAIFSGSDDSCIYIDSCCTFAYGVRLFSKSDDYLGSSFTGSVVPQRLTNPVSDSVVIYKHVIIGTSSVIFPGVCLAEGTAVGAMSLVNKSTEPWTVYAGIPARAIRSRSSSLLKLCHELP